MIKKKYSKTIRLRAWVALQALVVAQILPPFAVADELRAQSAEGAAQSGLEEALVARPAGGFATRVERVTPEGMQVAKRAVGRLLEAEVTWHIASGNAGWILADLDSLSPEDRDAAGRVIGWANQGLSWLQEHRSLAVIEKVGHALWSKGRPILRVELRADHAMTMDFNDEDSAVRLDTSIAAELNDSRFDPGRRLLYTVGMLHEAALAAGFTLREAIHLALGLYQNLKPEEQKALQQILRSPYIDHGDTWALFFEDASSTKDLIGQDTLALEERLAEESSPEVRRQILAVRNQRERWVSWLMGQLMVDLPYDRIKFREAMETGKRNVEAGRRAAYEAIRGFHREVEKANAERMSTVVREHWLPEELNQEARLTVGRASRAFDNQGQLLANSYLVLTTKEIMEATQQLHQAAKGESLIRALEKIGRDASPAIQEEMDRTVRRVQELLAHLGPGADRARQLVFGSSKAVPSTQYAGALQQLRENVEIFYAQAAKVIEQAKDQAVASSAENVRRRPPARALDLPFNRMQLELSDFAGKGGQLADLMEGLREEIQHAPAYPVAFSVLMQRPSPTGSEKFKANELEEKPEQEEALRKLTRLGGQNLYMSPSYDWVAEATDLIEAAPLFIYERTVEVEGKTLTVFEVDQEALEQTIRQMADYWALNIEKTMDSEHLALAREMVVNADPALRAAALKAVKEGLPAEAAHREALREIRDAEEQGILLVQVARAAAWIAREYDRRTKEVEKYIEKQWAAQNFMERVAALRAVIAGSPERALAKARTASHELQPETTRLIPLALARQRPLPAFHLLTTEAPGLVEGFIQAVLDEEMALRNVVRAEKLEDHVRQRVKGYTERVQTLGQKVIQEFGYEPIVEQYKAQGLPAEQAIRQVVGDHRPLQEELAKLAILAEMKADPDPADPSFERQALALVWERNKLDPDLAKRVAEQSIEQAIRESNLYRQELESTIRWLSRRQLLESLDKQRPELHLKDREKRWYRDHTALAQTAARRETIASNGLNGLMMDPRYAYSSGVVAETQDGKLRPTGARKRYHLIYAPSRVNLGKGERESVEVWPQWAGVTDPLAAAHAKQFYELINFNPQIRTIKEAENLKVSENQWTAMVRAVRNVEAYFVERLGVGDIEDLAFQFDQRTGLPGATLKQGESYQAGPTAGYCIPKDLLFKLFVATHQDERKLSQIGVPKQLHAGVVRLMVRLAAAQQNFETTTDWESWAAAELLSQKSLQEHFAHYVSVSGGVPVFHLTKMLQLLAHSGVPSARLAPLQDLHAALWSNWAERKLTLPSEQVNRSLVFGFTRQIPEAAKEAQALNPGAEIAGEGKLRVHFYGTYKGDENAPSPPDVRYAWIMRSFMILAGFGKEVALSLDEEGQTLARLSWEGFRPESDDPEDRKVTRTLAEQFGAAPAVVERLKKAFPRHTTVGDAFITVVPGVSTKDLLGFSSETGDLLDKAATQAQEILLSKGISLSQMQANAQLRRAFPEEWVPLNDLPAEELEALKNEIGGKIHPLVLRLRGPGTDFLTDLQEQDVAVFSVTHPEMMQIDPAHLRDRMLEGRPNSALTALDYVAQGRHRVWFDRDVMLWYAAGRGIDQDGRPIDDWRERDAKGRRAVYRAFGLGTDEHRPLLGTDLRGEVSRQERRARELFDALEKAANVSEGGLPRAVEEFRARYGEQLPPGPISTEAQLAGQYEQQMLANRRFKPRDAVIREALVDLATGLAAEEFGEAHWLAAGGMYLLNGAPKERQERVLAVIRKARQRMGLKASPDPRVPLLIKPGLTAEAIRPAERKGEMFSVKASETVVERAVARRKGLALQAARLAALKARDQAFQSVQPVGPMAEIPAALETARTRLLEGNAGAVMGITVQVLRSLAENLAADGQEKARIEEKLRELVKGGELNVKVWNAFGGTYEERGILARLFELAGPARQDKVLAAMELLTMTLALEKTASFLNLPPEEIDEQALLRSVAGFFAETIDDHYHEYNPWALDPKRGTAFKDFYDDLGILKPEKAEELYRISWEHHRSLYRYVRNLVFTKSGARLLSEPDRRALFGEVTLAASPALDRLEVPGIGAGAPGRYERLWRGYNQFREMAFLRNDGFALPAVFERMDPNDPEVLDAGRRVNFAFLSPVGRTHYSRALMEAGELGENLFITRDGEMAAPAGAQGEVLRIRDAHFWLTQARYRRALIRLRGMSGPQADEQIERDIQEGRMTPKGIRAAARFTQPVTLGSVVLMHHHSIADRMWAAGYPGTDKSPGLYEMSYDKSLYPKIYNPPEESGVLLPPEIDWLREESEKLGEAKAKQAIAARVEPFAREHGMIVAKGSAESGARNFKRLDFVDAQGRLLAGEPFDERLAEAADFIYDVSTGQNVTLQRAIIVTPISWMAPEAVQSFVERQIRDWSVPVNLKRQPKSWVYGTLRIILSSGIPKDLNDAANWTASHPIGLTSLQVATNVGRQGTLEMLMPELIRPEIRETFIQDLEEAGRKAMAATGRYGKRYWDEVYAPEYLKEHGEAPRELDAAGVPYWWPRYLMLDFLPEPVWGRNGQQVPGARVVNVVPGDPKKGTQARFTLRDPQGNLFEGQILRFTFWLLEPNVGIGLWANYWRREEAREKAVANAEGRPMNWSNVGVSDRIVLKNYLAAGESFLKAKFGGDYFGPTGPRRGGPDEGPSPAGPPVASPPAHDEPAVVDPADDRVRISPPVDAGPPSAETLGGFLPHPTTFAVVVGKETLMNHHLYPWIVAAAGRPVNVVGLFEGWLTPDGRATRLMAQVPNTGHLVEYEPKEPVKLDHAFIVELPQSIEVRKHRELTGRLTRSGVNVVNPGGPSERERAEDKGWFRLNGPQGVAVPQTLLIDRGTPADRYKVDLGRLIATYPEGVVIQPRADTTEGQGVRWFDEQDRDAQEMYLETLLTRDSAMVSAYRGNVTYQGRPAVLRLNVAAGEVASATAIVAGKGEKIVSLGRGGNTEKLEDLLNGLEGPSGPVAFTEEAWDRLRETARAAAAAAGLTVAGIDLVMEADDTGEIRGVVLEANVRPGLLIFGEQAEFSAGSIQSHPAPPAGGAFWDLILSAETSSAGAEEENNKEGKPVTLSEWQQILADPVRSGFWERLKGRYGEEDGVLAERLSAYASLISGAIHSGFDRNQKVVVVVASPGRDRVFMGHTDSPGLGGPTINVATENEILGVLQATDDGKVHIQNVDPAYRETVFPLAEIRNVARKYPDRAALFETKREWDPAQWDSYLRGALAFMVGQLPGVDQKVGSSGIRLYVASVGAQALPATGGVSSSSALTGTISVGMNALFRLGLSLEQLAEVDYGEYLEGKTAGAGDKAAQLNAQRGQVVVVGSFPERSLGTVDFPQGLTVLMAESPIPRLSSADGLAWLSRNYPDRADQIYAWAKDGILRRFGSRAYVRAVQDLRQALQDPERSRSAGLTDEERAAVFRSLQKGFLRELTDGGSIEQELPGLAGWKNRPLRYRLIYRLLKLLPEQETVESLSLSVRKAALYGLAELERGAAYLRELQATVEAEKQSDDSAKRDHLTRVLNLVRWAHDGDRATVDHRNGFQSTPWAGDPRNDVSDLAIDRWIADGMELVAIPGGFERSIADLDEMVDEVGRRFEGKAAMRVAAAGMGGTMAIHALTEEVPKLREWLEQAGWKVRDARAGAPTQVIVPPALLPQPAVEGFDLVGSTVVAKRTVRIEGKALQLPNGSWLDAAEGVIVLGEGTIIGPHSAIYSGSILLPVTDETGKRHPVRVFGAQVGDPEKPGPVVIWGGTDIRLGALVRPNTILGPFTHIGPGSEAKATVWMGASPNKNDSALAHRSYGGNLIGIPVYLDGTPLEEVWHQQLFERLSAFRFGRVISRRTEKSERPGPQIRPREDLVIQMGEAQVPVSVRGINFGDEAGVSNFKTVSGGRKAIGVISAGVAAGTTAKVQTPVFIGPDSLLDNGAVVKRLQAAAPGTVARPIGRPMGKAFLPGAVDDLQGKSDLEATRLFLANLRVLLTLARVSAAGLQHNLDPTFQEALKTEIQALKGHYDEVDAFTAKELALLGTVPEAAELAAQAKTQRAEWAGILQSGSEEWAAPVSAEAWAQATDPAQNLIQSFSGIRSIVGPDVPLPVSQPLPETEIAPEQRLIFGWYGYRFAIGQIRKLLAEDSYPKDFLFALARDPRPSGRAVIEAQVRGMKAAAREMGVHVRFADGKVLPTPFAEGLVRMEQAQGGVISTASHNPLMWNGVKYPTGVVEPAEDGRPALVQAGILLPAGQMAAIVREFRDGWSVDDFRARLNAEDSTLDVEVVPAGRVLRHMVKEARMMWGLEGRETFRRFREQAGGIKVVLDPNGGAASRLYAAFLRRFGLKVFEINSAVGQPQHLIEPIRDAKKGDALADAIGAMQKENAQFAVVFDYDADRGNTLFRDPATGKIEEPTPWAVATMNTAMALARARRIQEETGDSRPLAAVVHDAPSQRMKEVAKVFGAKLEVVEVGEVNVLQKMRQLERGGYRVVIGAEIAGGGSVFRGDHPVFQGDTSRNGAMTALFTAITALDPEIGRTWLRLRNEKAPANVARVPVSEEDAGGPSLAEILKSLPGEQADGDWHFVTRMETPAEKEGARGEVPEEMTIPFKQAVERILYERIWPMLRDEGLKMSDGSTVRFASFRKVMHVETSESPAYGAEDPAGAGVGEHGMGGWSLQLETADGKKAELWFRGSLTEGMLRAASDAQGVHAEELSRKLLDLYKGDWYLGALKGAREAAAGTEEEIPLDPAAAARTLVVLTPTTVEQGIRALSGLRGQGGERVRLAAIVSSHEQAARVGALLAEAGLKLEPAGLIDMEDAWTFVDAVRKMEQLARGMELDPVVIRHARDLLNLGRLLLPVDSQQRWNDWVAQQAGLETQL